MALGLMYWDSDSEVREIRLDVCWNADVAMQSLDKMTSGRLFRIHKLYDYIYEWLTYLIL